MFLRAFRIFIFFMMSFFSVVPFANAASCSDQLAPKSTKQFSGFLRVSSNRELYVKLESPKAVQAKGYVVLIHGLLDSHKRFDEMSKQLLKKGYGVLRMDIYGFGQSLVRELERNKGNLDFLTHLPYETNVQDLRDVILSVSKKFSIPNFQVLGHSMGGGLAAALLADSLAGQKINRVVMVAPYIYRMERFEIQSAMKSTNPWRAWMPKAYNDFWDEQTENFIKSFLNANDSVGASSYLNSLLKDQFEKHLEELGYGQATKEVKNALLVSAIATVRGLRDLDVIALLDQIPSEEKMDLVISLKDSLVRPDFQEKLASNLNHRNSEIYRLNTDHLVPTEAPSELVKILTQKLD